VTPRAAARAIFDAALAAARVAPLVQRVLHGEAGGLAVDGWRWERRPGARLVVLGLGKAAATMAQAVEAVVGNGLDEGLVVVKDGYGVPTRRVQVLEAGHPVPDARGQAAALRLLELARRARADDLVLVLISGGGSALTPAPAPPVSLEDKQTVTRLLLEAGATIHELNAVRKHLSLFKGGQLARAAAPAEVLALVLSDVIGDPLDVIASGPTAPDPSTFDDALGVLERRGLRERVPATVLERLSAGRRGEVPETPKPGDPLFARVRHVVVGNNALVVEAAAAQARALGWEPVVVTRALAGEARVVARELVERARRLRAPACLIAGGETTVTVRGPGRGGRCQEFALAAALALRPDEELVVLAAGTDGTDGPTDAAGAVVDASTAARARAAGLDPARALADHDSHRVLAAAGDLVITGPTGTNLLDLYLILGPRCPRGERGGPTS
jgi:glycerate 2-kinase